MAANTHYLGSDLNLFFELCKHIFSKKNEGKKTIHIATQRKQKKLNSRVSSDLLAEQQRKKAETTVVGRAADSIWSCQKFLMQCCS